MSHLSVRVAARQLEAEDIVSLELVSVDGTQLPPFSAGSHIDIVIAPGLTRQYSLANAPDMRDCYRVGILKDPGSRGGSVAMHQLQVGDMVRISEPRNHFPLVPAERTLLLAGGIGITPILCMAERLSRIGSRFEMHYCARSPQRTAFRDTIGTSAYAGQVHFHFDDGAPSQKLDLDLLLATPDKQTHVYVCGPGGFIDAVLKTAVAKGWPQENIHREYFGAPAVAVGDTSAFDVKIASSGRVIAIPADRTITEVLAENGIDIPISCEQGVCGTCITRVLQGHPDHRDAYFTDEEKARNDQFTPCCSRSKSGMLVLDL